MLVMPSPAVVPLFMPISSSASSGVTSVGSSIHVLVDDDEHLVAVAVREETQGRPAVGLEDGVLLEPQLAALLGDVAHVRRVYGQQPLRVDDPEALRLLAARPPPDRILLAGPDVRGPHVREAPPEEAVSVPLADERPRPRRRRRRGVGRGPARLQGLSLLALVGLSLGSWVAPAALGDYGLNAFAAVYFAMGFCEGPSYPSTGVALARWIPEHERSKALSIADTGSSVGSMVAFSLAPVVALYAGWRRAFTLCAYWSAAVALAWAAWAASGPASCARLPAEERAYLREHGLGVGKEGEGASEKGLSRFPAFPRRLFRARSVWATVYAHAAFNFGRYFVYNSLVGFYVDELGTSPVVAGQHVLLGQIADTVGKFAFVVRRRNRPPVLKPARGYLRTPLSRSNRTRFPWFLNR